VYARERLGDYWGFLAGWSFVVGKTASLSAMALTFGAYVDPDRARPLGIAAVVVMAAVNYRGVEKTARLTRLLVVVILSALAVFVAAALLAPRRRPGQPHRGSPDWALGSAAVRWAAVLRLRRLRATRHAGRGGP
jgi:basic amino acid/polyamine antiporter, APA family